MRSQVRICQLCVLYFICEPLKHSRKLPGPSSRCQFRNWYQATKEQTEEQLNLTLRRESPFLAICQVTSLNLCVLLGLFTLHIMEEATGPWKTGTFGRHLYRMSKKGKGSLSLSFCLCVCLYLYIHTDTQHPPKIKPKKHIKIEAASTFLALRTPLY